MEVSFTPWGGGAEVVARARPGQTVLEVAQANGVPLEGACEGSKSCSTCHVVVTDACVLASLPAPCEDELDMLDVAVGRTDASRLGCCILAARSMRLRLPPSTDAEFAAVAQVDRDTADSKAGASVALTPDAPPPPESLLGASTAQVAARPLSPFLRLDEVHVRLEDGDPGATDVATHEALVRAVEDKLGVCSGSLPLAAVTVVRKSLDARQAGSRHGGRHGSHGGSFRAARGPVFTYVVDVDLGLQSGQAATGKGGTSGGALAILQAPARPAASPPSPWVPQGPATAGAVVGRSLPRVVVVGAGPAGLFAALTLASSGKVHVTLVERGQPVDRRGVDIGHMYVRPGAPVDANSNMLYGMGGAGTWSDGKLTTRIGKNSDEVRSVLSELVGLGAPNAILAQGKPHLGTDRMVAILRRLQQRLTGLGVDLRFGCRVDGLRVEGGKATGVVVRQAPRGAARGGDGDGAPVGGSEEVLGAEGVFLAIGHSARDLVGRLHAQGKVVLAFQPFAAGLRAEHPQALIDELQYGAAHADLAGWRRPLPSADYRLVSPASQPPASKPAAARPHAARPNARARPGRKQSPRKSQRSPHAASAGGGAALSAQTAAQTVFLRGGDGDSYSDGGLDQGHRAAYSFCMCPGGQVVPTALTPDELCVNGMSFSKRSSPFANSGLVVPVALDDCLPFVSQTPLPGDAASDASVLAGLAFQRAVEREAALRGGGKLVCPVQTIEDFIVGRDPSSSSSSSPSYASSYRLGVRPAALHDLYPLPISDALRHGLRSFEAQMPGYVGRGKGLLHGAETRTSSPVRLVRDPGSMQSASVGGLYPLGEGAGYAGGIVSAAVDGARAARALLADMGHGDEGGVLGRNAGLEK